MTSLNLASTRQRAVDEIHSRINRKAGGRVVLYDISAGLGKTMAMMHGIGAAVRHNDQVGCLDAVLACWQSMDQMLDAVRSSGDALHGIHLRDALVDVPQGWDKDQPVGDWFGIPGFIYRGRDQLCEIKKRNPDATPICQGCPLYNECPYTWQSYVLNPKKSGQKVRLVLGSHALLKGFAANQLATLIGAICHVVVDENNNPGVIEVELNTIQLADIMRMCAWHVGAEGYDDLTELIEGLTNYTQYNGRTADNQAQVLADAFMQLRRDGTAQGHWWQLRRLLDEMLTEPRVFEGEEGDALAAAHITALGLMRRSRHDNTPFIRPGTQPWHTGIRAAQTLCAMIDKLLDNRERRKTVSVDFGGSARAVVKVKAAWAEYGNPFMDSNGVPADFHYLNATPTDFLIKLQNGVLSASVLERVEVRVDDDNLCQHITHHTHDPGRKLILIVLPQPCAVGSTKPYDYRSQRHTVPLLIKPQLFNCILPTTCIAHCAHSHHLMLYHSQGHLPTTPPLPHTPTTYTTYTTTLASPHHHHRAHVPHHHSAHTTMPPVGGMC